jgi:hypothetical protein
MTSLDSVLILSCKVTRDVGGRLGFKVRQRLYRFVALCSFIGSAASGVLALFLLAGAVRGYHSGSLGGTIVFAGLGFLLLLTSVLVFALSVVYLKSSKPRSEDRTD